MAFLWNGSLGRTIEKAGAAGYDEAALRAAAEMYASKDGRSYATNQDVFDAIRLVRGRKGNGHLPLFNYWGDLIGAPPTPPEGGYTYTLFEWRKGRHNMETGRWEEGQIVDGQWVAERVPMRNKNGTPLTRDVIGRFLAGMKGESGHFNTDGQRIFSYGWELAHWGLDKKGKPAVFFSEKMWEKPYGPTTSGHMSDIYTHLKDRAVNSKEFPERKIKSIAASIAHSAKIGHTMDELRAGFSYNYYFAPPWKKIFALARTMLKKSLADDREAGKAFFAGQAKEIYTAESIAAYRKWINRRVDEVVALLDAYEERLTTTLEYGKRWPAVPNRLMKQPTLIKKESLVSEKKAILGWWFSRDLVLGYGDNRPVTVGATHEARGYNQNRPIEACEFGLHASPTINQAYGYVSGRYLCRVMQWGAIDRTGDKNASQFRRYLAIYDTKTYGAPGETWGMDQFSRDLGQSDRQYTREQFEEKILAQMGMTADQRTPVEVPVAAE